MDGGDADVAKALLGPPLQSTGALHVLIVGLARTVDRHFHGDDQLKVAHEGRGLRQGA